MNVQQEGLGICGKCGAPIMQAIGQGNKKGVCLACEEAAKPKTGQTIVITKESGTGLEGGVEGVFVKHDPDSTPTVTKTDSTPLQTKSGSTSSATKDLSNPTVNKDVGRITLQFTLEDLEKPNILLTIMQALYDGIDNLPPPPTLKETKKAIAIQGVIEKQIAKLKGE